MFMQPRLCVVMSTYNGVEYLPEQLESLLAQSFGNVFIHIRDDGSTDNTQAIIASFADEHPNVTYEFGSNVGWKLSFVEALKSCPGYDYYSFCDQDDVWLPDKLSAAVGMLGSEPSSDVPMLYAGNVYVANSVLEPLFKFNKEPERIIEKDLPHTLTADHMAGGLTYVFNAKAREMLIHFPFIGLTGHDRILMLICKTYGIVRYDFDAYVLYRQHGTNVYGGFAAEDDGRSRLEHLKQYVAINDQRDKLCEGLLTLSERCPFTCSDSDQRFLRMTASYRTNTKNRRELLFRNSLGGDTWKHDMKLRIKVLHRTF